MPRRTKPTKHFPMITAAEIVEYRKKNNISQSDFWGPLGVSQSGGSRYESGREIPVPVMSLVVMTMGNAAQVKKVLMCLNIAARIKKPVNDLLGGE